MKNEKIKEYLKSEKIDDLQAWDLELTISNSFECQNILNYLQNYKNKKIKKNTFDPIQFVQLIKNQIDYILKNNKYFYICYNKSTVNVATRYATAKAIAENLGD